MEDQRVQPAKVDEEQHRTDAGIHPTSERKGSIESFQLRSLPNDGVAMGEDHHTQSVSVTQL
jgi:hypothetical protein